MVQQGVGEGTVERVRRNPRKTVDDVSIHEASGLTLGPDGSPHPLETTGLGELRATDRSAVAVLEDILDELRRMREGMVVDGLIADVE